MAPRLFDLGGAADVLRILRRSRPRSVRRWDQEEGYRLGLAARAHRALNRPRIALRLCRRLAAQPGSGGCREEIAELERMLGDQPAP